MKHFLSFARTKVLALLKCVWQVTGTGKSEKNCEEAKKKVEYRQREYVLKIIIGGERL